MPLEQLLALYGYGSRSSPPTSAPSTSQEGQLEREEGPSSGVKAQPVHTTPNPSVRSRRRNRVVPLEPQREVTPDLDDVEESTCAVPPSHMEKWPRGTVTGMETRLAENYRVGTSMNLSQALRLTPSDVETSSSVVSDVKSRVVQGMGGSKGAWQDAGGPRRVGLVRGKGAWQEDTDSEDVDVVEVSEIQLVKDENMLRLDQLARVELDVVRMDDIEAGLSKNEGALRLVLEDRNKGVLRLGLEDGVGLSRNEGALRLGLEDGVGLRNEGVLGIDVDEIEDEAGLGSYEGMELESGGEEEEEEESGLDEMERKFGERSGALYEDVLLSSGNARLLSDSTGNL